jgi:hypothetical protein
MRHRTIVLALIAMTLLLNGCGANRVTSNPASPPASSGPGDYGQPPAGVPLLYMHDPDHVSWLIGFDWTGRPRGTVKISPPLVPDESIDSSPDGQWFRRPLGQGTILDRLGRPVPGTPPLSGIGVAAIWADDNRHLCGVYRGEATNVWTLSTQLPGQSPKPVGVVAPGSDVAQTGVVVLACSLRNDRAILLGISISSPDEIWVIRMSDGTVVSHHAYAANLLESVVASRDAAYVAENSSAAFPTHSPQGAAVTRIRRVSDWAQVATPGVSTVIGFNDDDSLAIFNDPKSNVPILLSVVDWRSGSALWRDEGTSSLGGFAAEPGGRDIALILKDAGREEPVGTILIVHGDGTLTKIAGRYWPAW